MQDEKDFGEVLWRTLVQLKRVCVILKLPAHARAVGKLLDELEGMIGQEVDDGEDVETQERIRTSASAKDRVG